MMQTILLPGILLMMIMISWAQADVTRSDAQTRIHAAREAHYESVRKSKKEALETVESGESSAVVVTRNPEKKKVSSDDADKKALVVTKDQMPKTKEECAVMKNVKEKEACYKSLKVDNKKEVKEIRKATTTK